MWRRMLAGQREFIANQDFVRSIHAGDLTPFESLGLERMAGLGHYGLRYPVKNCYIFIFISPCLSKFVNLIV